MALTNDLRHRLTVFNKHQIENDIGETCWQYTEDGKIWGALTVMSGRNETLPGDTVRAEVTHKLTIRPRSCKTDHCNVFRLRGAAVRCAVLAAALQAPRPSGGHAEAGG